MIELSDAEHLIAHAVGRARHKGARERGLDLWSEKYGMSGASEEEAKTLDIMAVGAEMLVAKTLNLYWHPDLKRQSREEPDVGRAVQVRWTPHDHGRLIFHDQDYDEQYYVLVTGSPLGKLRIRGYIKGEDCRREEWWTTPKPNRPKAYYVPQSALKPIRERSANGRPESKEPVAQY